MNHFIFSADGHVVEPKTLFSDNMPASLASHSIRTERRDDYIVLLAGDLVLHRHRISRPADDEFANFGRPNHLGAIEIEARLEDMVLDGIDAEIVFPTAGLYTYLIEDPEAELATCQIYNDWNHRYFSGHLDRFVRCGILPVRDFSETAKEIRRLAAMGVRAAMLPSLIPPGVPAYNDERWDAVFEVASDVGLVFVLHTGTGRDNKAEKGPGGAIINYTIQMCDAQHSIMHMVAGGVLDRFPKVKIAVIECGASWLSALAERMDEANETHRIFVRPKLSIKPSEIIRRQVSASFQHDRAAIMARSVTGTGALMWASDYPHHEGTYPHSRQVIASIFDGMEISEGEKADILGGNAARLFGLENPKVLARV